jgi:hypothetical protein
MSETSSLPRCHQYIFSVAVLLVIIVKVLCVWFYGPMTMGDNADFINAAKEILANNQWLSDAKLNSTVFPPTLWRPIGYSMIIAGMITLFGENWSVALCALQALLSLLAGVMLYRLCMRAKMSVLAASAVFLLYQWSVPLSTDVLIMEDALTGVIGMTSFMVLLFPVVQNQIPSTKAFLLVGLMAAIAFLIRDVYHFAMPVLGLITLAVMTRLCRLKVGLMAAVALVLPVLLMATLLQGWNTYRTGSAVTTTSGQTAYLYAVLRAAQYDPGIIAGDDAFLRVARKENINFDYEDTRRINKKLFKDHAMNSIEQARIASQLFWGTLFSNPLPMIKAAMARTRIIQQGLLFTGPVSRLDDLHWWSGDALAETFYSTGWRAQAREFRETLNPSSLTPEIIFHLGLRLLLRILGVAALMVFLIGAPWLWLRMRAQLGGIAHAAAMCWGVYILWVCMYIPVSFEVRYLSPLIGPALMTLAIVLANIGQLSTNVWFNKYNPPKY